MAMHYGIDVSEYQSQIDWKQVRDAGKSFAILRCGYGRFGSQIDRRFRQNYERATMAGVDVGAYLFSYALTQEQAREEAENCLNLIHGKRFAYPIVYDVETKDSKLSTFLSDGVTNGSSVENAITNTIKMSGSDLTLKAGYKYTVALHLGLTSVKFDATVSTWDGTVTGTTIDLPQNAN